MNVSLTNAITTMVQPSGLKKMRAAIYYESIIRRRQVQGWREGWCILGTQTVRQKWEIIRSYLREGRVCVWFRVGEGGEPVREVSVA